MAQNFKEQDTYNLGYKQEEVVTAIL